MSRTVDSWLGLEVVSPTPAIVIPHWSDERASIVMIHPYSQKELYCDIITLPFIPASVTSKWGEGTKLDQRLDMNKELFATGLFSYVMVKPSPPGYGKFLPVEFRLTYDLSMKMVEGYLIYP